MAESTPNYKRLTRTRTGHFSVVVARRTSLWLGKDHLLLVEQSGFTESHKRFYFRDLQAIAVCKTNRRTIWNAVLTVPLVICLIGFMASAVPGKNAPAMVIWTIFLLIFSVPLAINNLLGTACTCQFRTAVQIEEITSLGRVRQAQKVLDKIRPLIVAAQGQLTPEEVSLRMHGITSGETASSNPASLPSSTDVPPVNL